METEPNYELLKDAYAIIDGIPETAIAFGLPRSREGTSLAEGTVCSPEGWLALHPTFNQLGLMMSVDGTQLWLDREPGVDASPAMIMAKVFNLVPVEAQQLFGDRYVFTGGDDSGHSDKTLWLRRVREYLQQKGQIGEQEETGMLAAQMQERGMGERAGTPPM